MQSQSRPLIRNKWHQWNKIFDFLECHLAKRLRHWSYISGDDPWIALHSRCDTVVQFDIIFHWEKQGKNNIFFYIYNLLSHEVRYKITKVKWFHSCLYKNKTFLSQEYIALVPLAVYLSGFVTSFLMRPVNRIAGRKVIIKIVFSHCGLTSWEISPG